MITGSGPDVARAVVALSDALHARPANLFVRAASGFEAKITLTKGACSVDGKRILEVLALGAVKGDLVELLAEGPDATAAVDALRELVDEGFDADLVPERGEGGAAGIAIGRALLVLQREESDVSSRSVDEERGRLVRAAERVEGDVRELIATLPAVEAALFEPEVTIVAELSVSVAAREAIGRGLSAEDAVRAATEDARTDLVLDARARLLTALTGGARFSALDVDPTASEHVLVTADLVPSLVAVAPRSVSGIVASRPAGLSGRAAHATSHAAILARGRGLPLAFVPEHVTDAVAAGDWVVVDASETEARVWVEPSPTLLAEARARKAALAEARRAADAAALGSLEHVGVVVGVNIGAVSEAIPAAADGVGLVRTELLHAAWQRAPDEGEHALALSAVARSARGRPVVARLYDAGGDKPLPWLPDPAAEPGARGAALLFRHPRVLAAQLAAMARVRQDHDLRVLIPLTRSEDDVRRVKELSEGHMPVGAMIETPEAVARAEAIAAAADFVCIGTNDLAVSFGPREPALGQRVLSHVRLVVRAARACGKDVSVCGELAADPRGARVLVGLGVRGLSVAPPKLAAVRAALRATTREACEREAADFVGGSAADMG